MKKTTKQQETTVVTRAEKKDATKQLIREILAVNPHRHNELIDEVAKLYAERFEGEGLDNINDVKGRVGSVLDIMKKESDVIYADGMYALKARLPMPTTETQETEKPVKKTRAKTKKTEETAEKAEKEQAVEEPAPKQTKRTKKETAEKEVKEVKEPKKTKAKKAEKEEKKEDVQPLPPAPLQPIAPVAPITPEVAPEPLPESTESAPAPKKRSTRAKAKKEETAETATPEKQETVAEKAEESKTEQVEIKNPPVVKEKAEIAKKNVVMDMSFLFGEVKPTKPAEKKEETKPVQTEKKEEPAPVKPVEKKEEAKAEIVREQKTETVKTTVKPAPAREEKREQRAKTVRKPAVKNMTADEKLCEAYLKRIRSLGGDYFEYYSVYLLERYSMKNGRRLEGMRVCGGDHDGGIDGEIELTDKFGFRETIYIQSKNWDPDKGDERLWVVGETLLQQFIGACACKQAKDRKQHCRGIFVTTSRFTPDAKRILEDMSDKIVGYDGADLYEAAKECEFGLVKKNGEWALDEKLLSGVKAFFNMY